jgi:GntR family transcriptional regulator
MGVPRGIVDLAFSLPSIHDMQFWLSKDSDVPLREQLTTQIKLAILSQDLKPGERLPSTRELARRFRIHSNTVSAAYRELSQQGWVDLRSGSGIYVRTFTSDVGLESRLGLDNLIIDFLQAARRRGFSLADIQSRVRHWMRLQPPDHLLVIDPDPEFRAILVAELRVATQLHVAGASVDDCVNRSLLIGAVPVALYGQAEIVTAALPARMSCLLIHTRSISETLKDEKRPSTDELIIVVSRWPAFLQHAHTVLSAVKIDPLSLSFRDAREPQWQKGLRAGAFVITDAATAEQIPTGVRTRVFKIIADSSLAEIRSYTEKFLSRNGVPI